MPTIENEYLRVEVSCAGGSLTSVYDKFDNKEIIYQMNPLSWQGQDIIIFPIIGKMKNECYKVDAQSYYIKSHGLLRYNRFEIERINNEEMCLKFSSNKKTLVSYPFEFDLFVTYRLVNRKVIITYRVVNLNSKMMYYYLGAHPAFNIDGVYTDKECIIDGNKIVFDAQKFLEQYKLTTDGSLSQPLTFYKETSELELNKDLFKKEKTLILNATTFKYLELVCPSKTIKISFDAPVVAIWSDERFGEYVCIEPWWGINQMENSADELKEKPLIQSLEAYTFKDYNYEIEIK